MSEGATSIQELQGNQPQNIDNGSRAVVQEILQEIENNDHNSSQNVSQQHYNMDANVQQNAFQPQSQEDSIKMQEEMMFQQQQQQQQQQMMQTENESNQQMNQTKTLTEKIISQLKGPIIVAAIFLLLSLIPTKQFLQKIPKALSETGSITFVGSSITAVIAGVIFYVINFATKNV